MSVEEKDYWVGFNVFEGIGPLRFKLLYDYFGSAEKAYNASTKELIEVGLSENLVRKFALFRETFDINSYLNLVEKMGIEIVTEAEESYPKLLREIKGGPPLIYVRSKNQEVRSKIFRTKAVALVGTRLPTPHGVKVTEMMAEGFVSRALVSVSAIARGADSVAHRTTIKNQGLTIAVLGCGLDKIYPPENKSLADEIVESGGALVTEFPVGMPARPGNFPARNRIISGLSLGTIVTEAAQDSGSLITASCAAEQGREVFAIPGPITNRMSEGTSELMKKGAKVVTRVEDVLDELGISSKITPLRLKASEGQGNLTKEEMIIVEVLKEEDLTIDDIIRHCAGKKSNLDSGTVGSLLSMLEIKGIVRNFGGIYSLK